MVAFNEDSDYTRVEEIDPEAMAALKKDMKLLEQIAKTFSAGRCTDQLLGAVYMIAYRRGRVDGLTAFSQSVGVSDS